MGSVNDDYLLDSERNLFQGIIDKYDEMLKGEVLPPIKIVDSLVYELVRCALALSDGNKARAARLLGINRTTLLEMIKRLKNGRYDYRHRG